MDIQIMRFMRGRLNDRRTCVCAMEDENSVLRIAEEFATEAEASSRRLVVGIRAVKIHAGKT